jgi:hypothetical protein
MDISGGFGLNALIHPTLFLRLLGKSKPIKREHITLTLGTLAIFKLGF